MLHTADWSRHHVLHLSLDEFPMFLPSVSRMIQFGFLFRGFLSLMVSFLVVIGVVPGGGVWLGQLLKRGGSSRRIWDPASV